MKVFTDDRKGGPLGGQRLVVKAAEAAALLGVSRAQFYRKHKAGLVPLPVRLGGSVRWRLDELQAWVAAGMPCRQHWLAMRPKGGAA